MLNKRFSTVTKLGASKKFQASKFDDAEAVLIKWYKKVNNIPVPGNILREKALETVKKLNAENCNASNEWVE